MVLYGGEGNDDRRDCGGGDTRSFKIELKKRFVLQSRIEHQQMRAVVSYK